MKRRQFLKELKIELRKRRDIEVEEVLFYYDELIQDAVDNGESEEVFIANLGDTSDIRRRIEDEAEFIIEMKERNIDVKNALSKTVKIIGYFIFGVVAFSITVACISVFGSGIAVIFTAIFKIVFNPPIDIYGYLSALGMVMVGVSLSLLSFGVMKWLYSESKPALLTIFRNINEFIKEKGK